MADDKVVVAPDSTGKAIDNSTVVTGAGTVYRQRVSIGDAASNTNAAVGANGLKVDGSGVTQPVSATGLTNLDVALSTRTKPADQQHAILDSGTLTTITNPVAVTGAFFQATQPVSIASTVAVSGTVALSGDALLALQVMRRDLSVGFLKPRPAFWAKGGSHA